MGKQARRALVTSAVAGVTLASAGGARAADTIYWGNIDPGPPVVRTIDRANLDGSGGGAGVGGALTGVPTSIAVDAAAGRMYWSNSSQNVIEDANLDGTDAHTLNTTGASPVHTPGGVALDLSAGRLYWADGNGKISYARLDGSGGGDLTTTGATTFLPFGLAIDEANGRLYWSDTGTHSIFYAGLDGSGGHALTIAGLAETPLGLAIDAVHGRLYWVESDTGAIRSVGVDGGTAETVALPFALLNPTGVALDPDAGRLYWTEEGGVGAANLDGSDTGALDTAGAAAEVPQMPAILERPSGAGAPAISSAGAGSSVTLSCGSAAWLPDRQGAHLSRSPASVTHSWTRDGGAVSGATDATLTVAPPGTYTCAETATNAAGSATQVSGELTVPAPPSPPAAGAPPTPAPKPARPNTKLLRSTMSSKHRRATFRFKAIGTATKLQCALRGPHRKLHFGTCRSPKRYRHLRTGRYTFEVRAVGPGGTDRTPARKRFRIR